MYSLDPGIRAEENLTDLPGAYDRAPGLSPDGRRIVFSSDRHDANGFEDYKNEYDLYSMNADGSGVRRSRRVWGRSSDTREALIGTVSRLGRLPSPG